MERELGILAGRGLNIFASAAVADLPADLASGFPAGYRSLLLFGHGGRALWDNLPHPLDPAENPVDRYALDQVLSFAREALGDPDPLILFPSSTAVIPLQRLGRVLNVARPSWLGLDIHRAFGVWFAYRAVLLTRRAVAPTRLAPFASPCESCLEKPCRTACPARAVGPSFDLPGCADERLSENSPCASSCRSRLACPYGSEHRYSDAQIRYHMGRPAHLRSLAGFATRR